MAHRCAYKLYDTTETVIEAGWAIVANTPETIMEAGWAIVANIIEPAAFPGRLSLSGYC